MITGGGTAGHVYPGLAVAKSLIKFEPGLELVYVGSQAGPEGRLAEAEGIDFIPLKITSFSKNSLKKSFSAAFDLLGSLIKSLRIIRKVSPDLILGTGGYASFPASFAAILLNKSLLLHEQNSVLGLANKALFPFASLVFTSFADTEGAGGPKVKTTGNPVRESIASLKKLDRIQIYNELGLDPNKKTLLVFGGSQGAKRINEALAGVLSRLLSLGPLQIIHLTGKGAFKGDEVLSDSHANGLRDQSYFAAPYSDEMAKLYAVSDLVLCRAGATTIAELIAAKLPSILIPYPFAAKDHQLKNAKILQKMGAAKVILDSDLTGETLFETVSELIFDDSALSSLSNGLPTASMTGAADKMAEMIISFKDSPKKER